MEAPLRCTFNSQEMLTDGREKRRKPDMWSPQERNEFIDVFLAQGRDFKAVLERVKSKNKEQVRQFYYRSLEKVNKLLRPFQYVIRDKSCADAILALKCYWTLERRCDRSPKNVAGFADELYRMIMEHKGASLTVGHAFSLSSSAPYASSPLPTLGGVHMPQPQQPLAQRAVVPAYLISSVIRPPPLIPSLSTTQFVSPAATPSPPRLSHLNFNNLNDFLPGPSVMLPSLQHTPALSFPSALPAQSLASYALQQDAQLHAQQLDAQLAPLKRHSAPEVHPTLPPLKRLKDAPPSPPPVHFSTPVAPVACWATAATVKREEEEKKRLRTAAEVLAALMPTKSVVA